jgi:hypothetical protein
VHPAVAMAGFWLLLYACYYVAPIVQTPSPSFEGIVFNAAFIVVYAIGCWAGSAKLGAAMDARTRLSRETEKDGGDLVAVLALIGCAGALISILDKASGVSLAGLIDAATLRNERAQLLLEAEANPGGVLSAVAFLLYPAGYAAVYMALLSFERLPRPHANLALAFVPLAFFHTVAAGGRSGILVLLILIAIAAYVRRYRGQSAFPNAAAVKWLSRILVVAFMLYSAAVWFVRSEVSEMDVDTFLEHAEQRWGVAPSPWLESVASPAMIQTVMSTVFYVTQSLSVTERFLSMQSVPMLLGGYHVDVVAAAMRSHNEAREFLANGYAELLEANVYGFFTGAWAALCIDFGVAGALGFTLVWGLLAGHAYKAMKISRTDSRAAMYGFSLYATAISFVSPPFGFANSATTFFWFLTFALALQHRPRLRPRVASR